jgi:DNA-binding CsgD family transcriptional regulator
LTVGPLSFGATCKIIHDRLGIALHRATARRLHATSGGNPLFGLELARALADRGLPIRSDEPLPLPESIDALLVERIAGLEPKLRTTLLAVAVSPGARVPELVQVVGDDALEAAVGAGLVVADGEHVRCAHPLLGEAARIRTRSSERRGLHARLAAAVQDDQRRALHLAQSASGADREVAAEVAAAAERAADRGAMTVAVELGERALALTPAGDPARDERLLDAAELNLRAGRLSRVGGLLEPALEDLAEGSPRARAMVLLAGAVASTPADSEALLTRALLQEPGRTRLRAQILIQRAVDLAVADVQQLARADAFATEALEIAREVRSFADQHAALGTLMWVRALRGQRLDELVAARSEIPEQPGWIYRSVDRIALVAMMWRGEIAAGRRGLAELLRLADERGESESYFALRVHLCELELRAGGWDAVEALLDEWETDRGEPQGHSAALLRCRALLRTGRGDVESALATARESIKVADEMWTQWHRLEALRALGVAQLLAGDPAGAAASLGEVWRHARAEGLENPGPFPVAPDLVQALVASGSVAQAADVADVLGAAAETQDHPWGRAAAARAHGWVSLGRGDPERACSSFAEAAERFEALELLFDAARARGELGTALRRARRKREARESLERAVRALEELGSPGWARPVQEELRSLGGRQRTAASELTATERRVADLVAQGKTNKEVAASLVVTVSAVEAHLTRIYGKLGVRSRAELARTYHG